MSSEWRVGEHYKIHVYEDETPVATFHTVADAQRAVEDHNDIDALRAAVSSARLTIEMWRGGNERGTDADVIDSIDRILDRP